VPFFKLVNLLLDQPVELGKALHLFIELGIAHIHALLASNSRATNRILIIIFAEYPTTNYLTPKQTQFIGS
jgi:hypothetical protein